MGLCPMTGVKYVYWEDNGVWVGYLEEFPDYLSQGKTLPELQENLRDIYHDIYSNTIPRVRHVDELMVS